ncbi:hypothetical protein RIF29_20189 [Crotalaria pallida]|uniref:Uncharacterized protein n=1 Tax=Crotalaria pallida TaxID=3830 RepID=A0AAN9F2G8_CROPI
MVCITFSLRINHAQSFDVWLKKLLDHEDMDTVAIAAICLWCIWKGRNGRVFEGTIFNLIEIVSMGAAMLQDYKDANDSAVQRRQHETSMPKWSSPPPQNWLMMNLDATCFDGTKTGLGAIGLHMIVSQGVQRIRINTGSQVLSKCFKGTSTISSKILHLALDCIDLLGINLRTCPYNETLTYVSSFSLHSHYNLPLSSCIYN